jgi:tRNA A-37 threonylcarbamoyl transferase component Bud32|uniref:non-specific serine/threonine protein kinase n=1 Tax=viral metagenome TaxID=1070528 RepID=A0A6C0IQU7_9ZZZZ
MQSHFSKDNVLRNEYVLTHRLYNEGIPCPDVISYDETSKTLVLTKINGMSIADFYGDSDEATPTIIFDQIRDIIKELFIKHICYPDITGYNFMIDENEKVWIIDFGHAYVVSPTKPMDEFVIKFMNGHNAWNPEFR